MKMEGLKICVGEYSIGLCGQTRLTRRILIVRFKHFVAIADI